MWSKIGEDKDKENEVKRKKKQNSQNDTTF